MHCFQLSAYHSWHGEGRRTYLLFNNIPFLPSLRSQCLPDLPTHIHITLRQCLQLDSIPIVSVPSFHQPLMSFPACVWCFGWKVCLLDWCPVHPLRACCHQCLVIGGCPGAG